MPGAFKSVTIGRISDFSVEIEAKMQDNMRAERAVVGATDAPKQDPIAVEGDPIVPTSHSIRQHLRSASKRVWRRMSRS
jgi:hypothetical protein